MGDMSLNIKNELTSEKEWTARFDRIMAIGNETSQILRNTGGPLDFEELYDERGLPTIEPVTASQATLARQAYRDFVHTDLRSALA